MPYGGGNEILWKLHQLSNIDKHRVLFTIGSNIELSANWIPTLTQTFLLTASDPHFDGLFDEDAENQMDQALVPFSRQLIQYVEDLVKSFEPCLEPPSRS